MKETLESEGPSDTELSLSLTEDLQHDMEERIKRWRVLIEIERNLDSGFFFLFGIYHDLWGEIRSSFVNGNFAATVLLCQALVEQTLASYLNIIGEEIPNRVSLRECLKRCEENSAVTDSLIIEIRKLFELRNPISHYRCVSDPINLLRRSMSTYQLVPDLIAKDAVFSLQVVVDLLAELRFSDGD